MRRDASDDFSAILFLMKIIFLNVWGGERKEALSEFLLSHATDTDIFCFQEAYTHTREITDQLLAGYTPLVAEKHMPDGDVFAQVTYIKKGVSNPSHHILLPNDLDKGLVIYTEIIQDNQTVHLCNVHGISQPGKLDTPPRIIQSQSIIDFMDTKRGVKVVGGDFNVLPDTESVKMFSRAGYHDLIQEYGIKTTRNRFAWEKYPENRLDFSDYVFTSPDVRVKAFDVPSLEISDHLPMIVEIDYP